MHPFTDALTPLVGTAPVNWNNSDLPDAAPPLPVDQLLDAMAACGYAGAEYGEGYPSEPDALHAALSARNLRLCGAYRWFHFTGPVQFPGELAALEPVLDVLAAVDCRHLIVADAMTPERIRLAGHVPADGSAGLTSAQWDTLIDHLAQVSALAARRNIQTHYHNHVGTHVETPTEVAHVLKRLPPGVDLCFDTGHYAFGGGDPVAFVNQHAREIGYLHLKDVDRDVLAQVRAEGLSFLDALRRFIFCDLGDGMVSISSILSALAGVGYQGWIVVEQDTCPGDPTETAARNRRYLRQCCGR
jgi:inosose dehydratase